MVTIEDYKINFPDVQATTITTKYVLGRSDLNHKVEEYALANDIAVISYDYAGKQLTIFHSEQLKMMLNNEFSKGRTIYQNDGGRGVVVSDKPHFVCCESCIDVYYNHQYGIYSVENLVWMLKHNKPAVSAEQQLDNYNFD